MQVNEVSPFYPKRVSANAMSNGDIIWNYKKLMATAIVNKAPRHIIKNIMNRKDRLENCNNFWQMETYEQSKVKRLLKTNSCHDRFCFICSRNRHGIINNRYHLLLEQYKDSLYHFSLTVPNCSGDELSNMIFNMQRSFKKLVRYLSGNIKIKGLDLAHFGFQGGICSLEISYESDSYHPHYHVVAVFDNPAVADDKHINNTFSHFGNRTFSEFEIIIQRMWYLLMNKQRLTYEAVSGESTDENRYSCIVDKCQSDEYKELFGYATKTRPEKPMLFHNFKTLYNALYGVRQIQGYGIFYNIKPDTSDYTEQECTMLSDFITADEEPTLSYEPLNRLANDSSYKIVKRRFSRS